MFRRNKGFTLIELLVVIAIIGILATIVLINLNTARDKAKQAAIKGALSEARAAAAMYYDEQTPLSYNGFCAQGATTNYGRIVANVGVNGGSITCNDSSGACTKAYCVQSTMPGTTDKHCVDSTGYSGKTANCDATACDCL